MSLTFSDPGAAINAALASVGADGSVWIRFVNGDYCRMGRTSEGWELDCDCGIRLEAESLSSTEGPKVVLTASSSRHPAVFRMEFLSASVDGVFLRTEDSTVPLLEAMRWTPASVRGAGRCSRWVRKRAPAAVPRRASPA